MDEQQNDFDSEPFDVGLWMGGIVQDMLHEDLAAQRSLSPREYKVWRLKRSLQTAWSLLDGVEAGVFEPAQVVQTLRRALEIADAIWPGVADQPIEGLDDCDTE